MGPSDSPGRGEDRKDSEEGQAFATDDETGRMLESWPESQLRSLPDGNSGNPSAEANAGTLVVPEASGDSVRQSGRDGSLNQEAAINPPAQVDQFPDAQPDTQSKLNSIIGSDN